MLLAGDVGQSCDADHGSRHDADDDGFVVMPLLLMIMIVLLARPITTPMFPTMIGIIRACLH